jgi:hypothetical protein
LSTYFCFPSVSSLKLGRAIEIVGSNALNVDMMTSHPIYPCFSSEIKLFTEGFIITKINNSISVPVIISFNSDISKLWVVDPVDWFESCSVSNFHSSNNEKPTEKIGKLLNRDNLEKIPNGLVLIFELKTAVLSHSLAGVSFGGTFEDQHYVTLFCQNTAERGGSSFPFILESWKPSLRVNDIEEIKGKNAVSSVPRVLSGSFFLYLDSLRMFENEIVSTSLSSNRNQLKRNETDQNETVSEFKQVISCADDFCEGGYPGFGYFTMKCSHSVAESRRLSSSSVDYQALLDRPSSTHSLKVESKLMIVSGLVGCGIGAVSKQLIQQVLKSTGFENKKIQVVEVDFTLFHQSCKKEQKNNSFSGLKSFVEKHFPPVKQLHLFDLVVIILTLDPSVVVGFNNLLQLIMSITQCPVVHSSVVTTPDSILFNSLLSASSDANRTSGVGREHWNSNGFELMHFYSCHNVILLESNNNSASYQQLKSYLLNTQFHLIHIMKMSCFHLYFEEEDISYYRNVLSVDVERKDITDDEFNASQLTLGMINYAILQQSSFEINKFPVRIYGSSSSSPAGSSLSFLRTIIFDKQSLFSQNDRNQSSVNSFSLTLFLKLLQHLFPSSVSMFSSIQYDWHHQQYKSGSSNRSSKYPNYQNLLNYAMKKVFHQFEHKEMMSKFEEHYQKLMKKDTSYFLISNIISLKAVLVIENERLNAKGVSFSSATDTSSLRRIIVEGNHGNIIYREMLPSEMEGVSETMDNHFTITGTFSASDGMEQLILSLLQLTKQYYLKPKEMVRMEDFMNSDRDGSSSQSLYHLEAVKKIQSMTRYRLRTLPSGFWFDGQFYLDHNGQHFELRPDIDEILDDYLKNENRKRKQYNQWLDELFL